jgi:integrase
VSRTKSPYVIDAAQEYLLLKAPKAKKTIAAIFALLIGKPRGTKKIIGVPFVPYFLGRRCDSLVPYEISGWFAQRCDGAAQATKHRLSKNSRAFLRFLYERGYTAIDLSVAIEPQPDGGGRIVWLEWQEVHRLLAQLPTLRLRLAIALLFYTGCRLSEAIAADQQEVQWDSERKMYVWSIPDSKTHRPRVVWLPAALNPLIEESRALNEPSPKAPFLWGCEGRGKADIEDPTRRIAISTITLHLALAAKKAGIHKHVTPHVAKHTYCTLWIDDQGDGERSLQKLAKQVGTTVENLRKTYVHLNLTDKEFEIIRDFGRSQVDESL